MRPMRLQRSICALMALGLAATAMPASAQSGSKSTDSVLSEILGGGRPILTEEEKEQDQLSTQTSMEIDALLNLPGSSNSVVRNSAVNNRPSRVGQADSMKPAEVRANAQPIVEDALNRQREETISALLDGPALAPPIKQTAPKMRVSTPLPVQRKSLALEADESDSDRALSMDDIFQPQASARSRESSQPVSYQAPIRKMPVGQPTRVANRQLEATGRQEIGGQGNPFVDDDQSDNPYTDRPRNPFDAPASGSADWVTACDAGGGNCGAGGCDSGGCGSGDCGCCATCSPWAHRNRVFMDYLYLRASGADVDYAVEVNGPPAATANQGIQMGRTAVVDHDYASGYRVGFAFAMDECSSLAASYTLFDTGVTDSTTRRGTNDIRSSVTHPLSNNAAADWLDANARLDLQYELADLEYRWLYHASCSHAINLSVTGRYAHMEQYFRSGYSGNGTRSVDTDILFDGGGLRIGGDYVRTAGCCGLSVYANAGASFLAGQFQADFLQSASFDPVEVETTWGKSRVVTVLDLELGAAWQSQDGSLGLSLGYTYTAWLDMITTDEFIRGVHQNNFDDLGETITFDGLVLRGEYRF